MADEESDAYDEEWWEKENRSGRGGGAGAALLAFYSAWSLFFFGLVKVFRHWKEAGPHGGISGNGFVGSPVYEASKTVLSAIILPWGEHLRAIPFLFLVLTLLGFLLLLRKASFRLKRIPLWGVLVFLAVNAANAWLWYFDIYLESLG